MLSVRGLWNRHRRKVFLALGALGSGYVIYKFYDAHRRRITVLERQLEGAREFDDVIKSQLQNHFENIQRISDVTTLPDAMHFLRSRIVDDLDVSYLTEKLRQAKDQYSTLTPMNKAELWDRLKILSFTRLTTSLWSMTMLCLYVKVLVNILGRHLYVDIARASESSKTLILKILHWTKHRSFSQVSSTNQGVHVLIWGFMHRVKEVYHLFLYLS